MKSPIAVALLIAACATAAIAAPQPVPYLPVQHGAAVMLNTGSTNATGYRIVVTAAGDAEYVDGSARGTARLPAALTAKLFADLRAAMPLSAVKVLPCMKSASFGYSVYVWWRGQRSHDVSCPGSPAAGALNDDVSSVAAALHIPAAAGSHGIPMPAEPRKPLPAASPSPSST